MWLALSKLLAAALLVGIAFKFTRASSFFTCFALFFFMNFVFLGVIYGILLVFHTPYLTLKNGTVYVDVGALTLVGCAVAAYVISCLVLRVYNRRTAQGEILTLTVENNGKTVRLLTFTDTGCRLREPFSDAAVIVAAREKVSALFDASTVRVIPAATVNGGGFLTAFCPERVTVHTPDGERPVERVYIAMSDELSDAAFSAVMNPEILSV